MKKLNIFEIVRVGGLIGGKIYDAVQAAIDPKSDGGRKVTDSEIEELVQKAMDECVKPISKLIISKVRR